MKTLYQQINEETAQQIWMAGYQIDIPDSSWAFDRAIHSLSLKDTVDKWTDEEWEAHADSWESFVKEVSK